jgi:tRNA modification GTPase
LFLLKDIARQCKDIQVVAVSALSGAGIEKLEEAFYKAVTGYAFDEGKGALQGAVFITTLREKDALVRAANAVEKSQEAVNKKAARECLALELRDALNAFGEISGETTSEDILNRIFSGFCIGK